MFQRTVHPHRANRAGGHRPPWRLLVESAEAGTAISNFDAFRRAGFDVTTCEGPAADARECPVVRGEACPLVDEADVVLFDGDGDPRVRARLLAALRTRRPHLPIVVRSAAAIPEAVDCATLRPTTSVGGQVSALRKAVLQWPSRQA